VLRNESVLTSKPCDFHSRLFLVIFSLEIIPLLLGADLSLEALLVHCRGRDQMPESERFKLKSSHKGLQLRQKGEESNATLTRDAYQHQHLMVTMCYHYVRFF